jgi:hypothetical protein
MASRRHRDDLQAGVLGGGEPGRALEFAERALALDGLNEGLWRLALEAEGALGCGKTSTNGLSGCARNSTSGWAWSQIAKRVRFTGSSSHRLRRVKGACRR